MRYDIGLEEMEGRWIAHVLPLFGCYITADTSEGALTLTPAAVAAYDDWRQMHGAEPLPASRATGFRLREMVREWRNPANPNYVVNAFFADDARSLTAAEVDAYQPLLAWAYADLLAAAGGLADELLDRPVVGEWNISGILNHCSRAAWWYLTQFEMPPPGPPADAWPDRLRRAHEHLLGSLPELAGNGRLTWHDGEIWSARKMLRRALWHLRDHTEHIYQFRQQLGV